MQNGKGIYTFEDGSKYDGVFKDDQKHGNGEYTFPSGTVKTGYWQNDQLCKWDGEEEANGNDDADQYEYYDEY